MLRAKVPILKNGTTSYVAPASRCLQILPPGENILGDDFVISIASGQTVQLAAVSTTAKTTATSSSTDDSTSVGKTKLLHVRSSNECSLNLFPSVPSARLCSSLVLVDKNAGSTSKIVTAASQRSNSDEVVLSVVGVDLEAMDKLTSSENAIDDRRRQRDGAQNNKLILSLKSSFAVPSRTSSLSSSSTSSSPFAFGSGGGSNYIGLDCASSSSSIFFTNGLNKTSSVIDVETQQVVASYSHHDGFAFASCSLKLGANAGSSTPAVAVSTGSFITLWDARQATPISQSHPHRSPLFLHESAITCLTAFCDNSNSTNNSSDSSCSSGSNYLLTGSADRAVTLWDLRKWTKQHVAQSALKFAPASIASASASASHAGNFVTVSGSDSEVRNLWVPLDHGKVSGSGGGSNNQKESKKKDENAPPENFNGATGGTFRQRLQDATHCATSWHGGWVGCNEGVAGRKFTIGLSRDYELFVAKV